MRGKERDYDSYIALIKAVIRGRSMEEADEIIEHERKRIWDNASYSVEKRREIDLRLQLIFMREKRNRKIQLIET